MKSTRSKACDIPQRVKSEVWERDKHRCVVCGSPYAMPNAHFIARSHGGLGIAKNIVTLCQRCHYNYDFTGGHEEYREKIKRHFQNCYLNWNESELVYRKNGL